MKPHTTITCAALFATFSLVLGASGPAHAEIETIVPAGAKFLQPFAAPKLPVVAGWETDLAASVSQGSRILFPAGARTGRPSAMIVVRAIPKKDVPVTSLDQLVDGDHVDTRRRDPGAEITEIPVVTDRAGRKIRVFAERAGNRRGFRMMAYGDEKDARGESYWTLFSLQAETQDGLAAGAGPFQDMLRNYR